jgi:hypothetical protein
MREATIHFTYLETLSYGDKPVYSIEFDEQVLINLIKMNLEANNISATVNEVKQDA